jgi:4-hydroxy-tetrahydrodipicolinate reductase
MAYLKLALLGDGRMGAALRAAAAARGHAVVAVVTRSQGVTGDLAAAEVALDFSHADALDFHCKLALERRLPLVIGTTGWRRRLDEVRALFENAGGAGVVHDANFSLGAHALFRLTRQAAEFFADFEDSYAAFLTEAHHAAKCDTPSGTALTLQRIVTEAFGEEAPLASLRAGNVPGEHVVGFDSESDTVTLTHVARHRGGFADGALLAAEWIVGRTGFYDFESVIDGLLSARRRASLRRNFL